MPKIRKKDLCPCGSGKRYKDCCFKTKKYSDVTISKKTPSKKVPRKKPLVSRMGMSRFEQQLKEDPVLLEKLNKEFNIVDPEGDFIESILKAWNCEKLRKMSTNEIIGKLHSMNISFDEAKFKNQAQVYTSAIHLAEDHYYTQAWEGKEDEDFIWLAVIELWNRLIPDRYTVEMIEYAMQDGYDYLREKNFTEALKKWEIAWDMVKVFVPPEVTSIEGADEFMPEPLTEPLSNWCQDFEMELHNEGLDDTWWFKKQIVYTNEFCQRFPHTDWLILHNMLQAEADSYAYLNDIQTAETLFKALVKKFPDYVWAYIGWGDIYLLDPPDYDKAENVYRLGLDHCVHGRKEIYDRLKDLEKERNAHKP
jgi:tetratricopeptide (TPR) repeat protein